MGLNELACDVASHTVLPSPHFFPNDPRQNVHPRTKRLSRSRLFLTRERRSEPVNTTRYRESYARYRESYARSGHDGRGMPFA
jgi:hypothetical protein